MKIYIQFLHVSRNEIYFFVKISRLTWFSIDAHCRPGTSYILWRSCYNYHMLLPPMCRTFFECVTYRRWYRIFPSTDRTVVLLPRMQNTLTIKEVQFTWLNTGVQIGNFDRRTIVLVLSLLCHSLTSFYK